MIVQRVAWLLAGLLFATGCGATVERGYYAPLGADFSDAAASLQDKRADLIIDVTCQGVYLNTVDGRRTRTAHVQLDITRTSARQLLFPIDGFRLNAVSMNGGPADGPADDGGDDGGDGPADDGADGGADDGADATIDDDSADGRNSTMTPHEAWSRLTKLHQMVLVNPWSNRSLDLFFDFEDDDVPIPSVLRLRWRAESDEGWIYGDCQFLRIAEDDPRCPPRLPDSDKKFGVRNGYYFPGYGVLGPRGLRKSVEAREHYLFHAP
jgi:hypothetical protein